MNTTTNARKATRGRRGVAMLMVVIALVVTSVLTTAILTTPDRLAPIAENAQDAARARWSARSAGNFTVSAIENEIKASAIGGKFKSDWDIARAEASVVVTNLAGDPPTDDDTDVLVTVTSKRGGIAKTTQRRLSVVPKFEGPAMVDTRLGDIALFVNETLDVTSSKIGVWPAAERFEKGEARIAMGTHALADVLDGGIQLRGVFCSMPITAPGVAAWMKSNAITNILQIPVDLPNGVEPMPSLSGIEEHWVLDVLGLVRIARVDIGTRSGQDLSPDLGQYGELRIGAGAMVRLGTGTYAFDDLRVQGGGELFIEGDTTLVVQDDAEIVGGSQILIKKGATLRLYVAGDLLIDDSVIGHWEGAGASAELRQAAISTYGPAGYSRLDVGAAGTIMISGRSVVLADIHAPDSEVEIEQSYLFGRLTGGDVTLDSACLYYEPSLDTKYGFTNLEGPLYDGGVAIPGLAEAIASNRGADPLWMSTTLTSLVTTDIAGQDANSKSYAQMKERSVPLGTYSVERNRDSKVAEDQIIALKERYLLEIGERAVADIVKGLNFGS